MYNKLNRKEFDNFMRDYDVCEVDIFKNIIGEKIISCKFSLIFGIEIVTEKMSYCNESGHFTIIENSIRNGDVVIDFSIDNNIITLVTKYGKLVVNIGYTYYSINIDLMKCESIYRNKLSFLQSKFEKLKISYYKYPNESHVFTLVINNMNFNILKDNYFAYTNLMDIYYIIDQIDGVVEFIKDRLMLDV